MKADPSTRLGTSSLVRTHLRDAEAYSSARHLAQEGIFFDANENAYGSVLAEADAGALRLGEKLNRYPDPLQRELRSALAAYAGVGVEQVFAGSGSDEAIDCLLKAFVEPGESVVVCTPTYGMYPVAATLHGAEVREAPLDGAFDLDVDAVLGRGRDAKLAFCCSPNNPTGNLLSRDRVFALCEGFRGLVVLDEAYVEFSQCVSLVSELELCSNLVVLRTMSKAWGLAAARVGYALAADDVVSYLLKVKMPYNMNKLSEGTALAALARTERLAELKKKILAERGRLAERLEKLGARVYPSEANFLLVRFPGAAEAAKALAGRGLIVRTWSREPRLEDCMRITVGRPEENDKLLEALAPLMQKEA
ncbi:MAG: histidinol-phosphate transaminase [Acidobacteriota bacterium]|nr:MAG: histidinol-phosphate transaminase [Acidobacteriota bacterium]